MRLHVSQPSTGIHALQSLRSYEKDRKNRYLELHNLTIRKNLVSTLSLKDKIPVLLIAVCAFSP